MIFTSSTITQENGGPAPASPPVSRLTSMLLPLPFSVQQTTSLSSNTRCLIRLSSRGDRLLLCQGGHREIGQSDCIERTGKYCTGTHCTEKTETGLPWLPAGYLGISVPCPHRGITGPAPALPRSLTCFVLSSAATRFCNLAMSESKLRA